MSLWNRYVDKVRECPRWCLPAVLLVFIGSTAFWEVCSGTSMLRLISCAFRAWV